MKPTDFAYHLTGYLSKYLPGQVGVSINTVKSYRDTFSLLLRFCAEKCGIPVEKLSLPHLNKDLIENFLSFLESERGSCVSTRNQRLAAIHAFFRYLQVEAPENIYLYQQILSVHFKRKSKTSAVAHLSLDAIQNILAQPDVTTPNGRRDLVLLSVLYDTGARVQEIADLTVRDIRIDNPATIKLTGKGGKSRTVPLMAQTKSLLEMYIKERSLDKPSMQSCPLFYNRVKEKLTRAGISYILDKYVQLARLMAPLHIPDKVTPHIFRHSKAMHLLQSGVNLVYIRDLLGHIDIATTEIYARADAEMKRKALENAYHNLAPQDVPAWQKDETLLDWLKNLGT